MARPTPASPQKTWSGWADRAIARGRAEAARAARFLDAADAQHPDLKGLSPEDRTAISARLHAAGR